jgi:hypothetical protein
VGSILQSRMKPIKYSDDSFVIRGEYPDRLARHAESITGVNVTISSIGGTALVAETAATLYTATTISADALHGSMYIVLAAESEEPSEGDRFLIGVSADGPAEQIICDHYDSDNRYLYLERELQYSHTSGAAVVGLWATYDLDASDTDVYTKGREIRVLWDPDTDDEAWPDIYRVTGASSAPPGFWSAFQVLYPTEYEMATNRDLPELEERLRSMFRHQFTALRIDVERIQDGERLTDGMLLFARYILTDEDKHKLAWVDWFKTLCSDPIWEDINDDGVKDENEDQIHDWDPIMRSI